MYFYIITNTHNMTHTTINTDFNETTTATIEYKVSFGYKFYVTTDVQLSGRGVTQVGNGSTHARGKKTYIVTEKAMDKIKTQYDTCLITCFD